MRANETFSEANRQFNDRNRAVLMNVLSPHRWWSTRKSAVFGTSSSLPPLVNEGGGLVCECVGKADLLSDQFDSKQSREAVDLSLTCQRVDSLIESSLREIIGNKNFVFINLSLNFCETTINDNKVFLENLVTVH